MGNAHRASAPAPTPQSLLEQAEALQNQAIELAAIISRAANDSENVFSTVDGTAALAKGVIRAREQRFKFLPSKLFSDPAWDILLELFSANLAQRRMTIGQICNASKVPATTALRWLSTLESNGLVYRHVDPLDARRSFVALTAKAEQAMEEFFQSIKESALAS